MAASHAGIDASLIVNKADLLSEAPSVVQLAETYSKLGVEVVTTGQLNDPRAETLMVKSCGCRRVSSQPNRVRQGTDTDF